VLRPWIAPIAVMALMAGILSIALYALPSGVHLALLCLYALLCGAYIGLRGAIEERVREGPDR
jgi:hypothetical protein